jgi:hypothetical protein
MLRRSASLIASDRRSRKGRRNRAIIYYGSSKAAGYARSRADASLRARRALSEHLSLSPLAFYELSSCSKAAAIYFRDAPAANGTRRVRYSARAAGVAMEILGFSFFCVTAATSRGYTPRVFRENAPRGILIALRRDSELP